MKQIPEGCIHKMEYIQPPHKGVLAHKCVLCGFEHWQSEDCTGG